MKTPIKPRNIITLILMLCWSYSSVSAEQCYIVVDNAGNFKAAIVETLSVSLISKYVSQVSPIPNAGIREDECTFRISLIESMNGFQLTFSSRNINSLGNSKQPGMDGLTQSLLRAISRSSDGSELKKRICSDYPNLMSQDCSPIEAVVMLYNDRGEHIVNGSKVREGDSFFVMLQPMADSYAAVFNKDSKGNFFRIFPNPQISPQTNPLKSNRQYFFPPKNSDLIFKFDANPGKEEFYFIISSTPLVDIESVYDNMQSGTSSLGTVLEQRIQTRGIIIGKKSHHVNTGYSNVPTAVEMLKGKGAVVKTVRLNHVRY